MPFQLVMVSPLLVPVWIAGLIAPFRRASLAAMRFVPLTYAALAVAYLVGNGKAYYLASMYPALLGVGAVPVADWTLRHGRRHRPRLRGALLSAGVVVSAAISALIALPLLPATSLQGSVVIAINPDQGETVGWPRFIDTVSDGLALDPATRTSAHRRSSPRTTAKPAPSTCSATPAHCPAPTAATTAFSEWGQPATERDNTRCSSATTAHPTPHRTSTHCTQLATINNGVGLDNNEQGLPVLLCRPATTWQALWPKLRHYN